MHDKKIAPAPSRLGFRGIATSKSLPVRLAEVTSPGRSRFLNNLPKRRSCTEPGPLLFVLIPHHRALQERRFRDCMLTQSIVSQKIKD